MGLNPIYVYLDASVVIYLVEEHPVFAPLLESRIAAAPSSIFVVSDLTEMECLVIPFRNTNRRLIDKFTDWFKQTKAVSLNKKIFHDAAQLRADFPSLKTPDALHLATAVHHGCDEFWTNDNRLERVNPSLIKNILTI